MTLPMPIELTTTNRCLRYLSFCIWFEIFVRVFPRTVFVPDNLVISISKSLVFVKSVLFYPTIHNIKHFNLLLILPYLLVLFFHTIHLIKQFNLLLILPYLRHSKTTRWKKCRANFFINFLLENLQLQYFLYRQIA